MQNVHLARASKIFTGFVILISSFRPQPHPPDRRWYDQLRIYKYTFWHANYIQMTNYFKIISRTGRCWGNWNNWHTYRGNADVLHVADCYTDYVLRSLKHLFAALSCYYGALHVAPDDRFYDWWSLGSPVPPHVLVWGTGAHVTSSYQPYLLWNAGALAASLYRNQTLRYKAKFSHINNNFSVSVHTSKSSHLPVKTLLQITNDTRSIISQHSDSVLWYRTKVCSWQFYYFPG